MKSSPRWKNCSSARTLNNREREGEKRAEKEKGKGMRYIKNFKRVLNPGERKKKQ